MSVDRLHPAQRRVLELLAELEPRWTLVGGAALAGFHLGHRATRDLDLFFSSLTELGALGERATAILQAHGLQVRRLETTPSFMRLAATDGDATTIIVLVADPSTPIEPPEQRVALGAHILVATPHAVLVDKLCALLGRSEARDLADVRALLAAGQSLEAAVAVGPRRDAGFSPLTLAWVLQTLPSGPLAAWDAELPAFRDDLVERLLALPLPALALGSAKAAPPHEDHERGRDESESE